MAAVEVAPRVSLAADQSSCEGGYLVTNVLCWTLVMLEGKTDNFGSDLSTQSVLYMTKILAGREFGAGYLCLWLAGSCLIMA